MSRSNNTGNNRILVVLFTVIVVSIIISAIVIFLYYAKNNNYLPEKYQSTFLGSDEKTEECPMSTPLLMYFDFSKNSEGQPNNPNQNQTIKGLSDVIFSVEGDNDIEKARTLKRCWCHTNEFGEITK